MIKQSFSKERIDKIMQKVTVSSSGLTFLLVYSISLFCIASGFILCHEYGPHNLSHTLSNLLGLLIAPIVYSAFMYPRKYYLSIIFVTTIAVAWIFLYIHISLIESFTLLTIAILLLIICGEMIGKLMLKQKKIESELLFIQNALEARVELRTAELQFLNRQLTADLDMLQKADDARKASQERLKTLINSIPDSILRIRCDGVCLEYKPGEGIGKIPFSGPEREILLSELMQEETALNLLKSVQNALESGNPQIFEFQYEHDGTMHDFEARLVVISNLEVLVMIRDMTERKRLEKEILEISQREQNRIGRDLHDGLGQLLTGISCLLQGLSKKIKNNAPNEVESVHEISDLVKQAIHQSSWLAQGLMPVKLQDGGLDGALQDLVEQTEHIHKVPCLFHCDSDISFQDATININLYRIAQEALNNAIKHSMAKHIWLRLETENEYFQLTVKDDGIGLTNHRNRPDGMGLRIMQYRAGMIGAELEIQPDQDGGTIVQCRIKHQSLIEVNSTEYSDKN